MFSTGKKTWCSQNFGDFRIMALGSFANQHLQFTHSANGQPLNFWWLYIYIYLFSRKIKFKLIIHMSFGCFSSTSNRNFDLQILATQVRRVYEIYSKPWRIYTLLVAPETVSTRTLWHLQAEFQPNFAMIAFWDGPMPKMYMPTKPNRILFRVPGWWFPIFPNGILRVPQEHPLPSRTLQKPPYPSRLNIIELVQVADQVLKSLALRGCLDVLLEVEKWLVI